MIKPIKFLSVGLILSTVLNPLAFAINADELKDFSPEYRQLQKNVLEKIEAKLVTMDEDAQLDYLYKVYKKAIKARNKASNASDAHLVKGAEKANLELSSKTQDQIAAEVKTKLDVDSIDSEAANPSLANISDDDFDQILDTKADAFAVYISAADSVSKADKKAKLLKWIDETIGQVGYKQSLSDSSKIVPLTSDQVASNLGLSYRRGPTVVIVNTRPRPYRRAYFWHRRPRPVLAAAVVTGAVVGAAVASSNAQPSQVVYGPQPAVETTTTTVVTNNPGTSQSSTTTTVTEKQVVTPAQQTVATQSARRFTVAGVIARIILGLITVIVAVYVILFALILAAYFVFPIIGLAIFIGLIALVFCAGAWAFRAVFGI